MARQFQEQEEGYYASMTDLMVGVIFIFIIIVMILSFQIKKQQVDVPKISDELRDYLLTYESQKNEFPNIKLIIENYEGLVEKQRQEIENSIVLIRKGEIKVGVYENFLEIYQWFIKNNEEATKYILDSLKVRLELFGFQNIEVDYNTATLILPVALRETNQDVLFYTGKYMLSQAGLVAIKAISDSLLDLLPCYSFQKNNRVDLNKWLEDILKNRKSFYSGGSIHFDKDCHISSYTAKIKTVFVEGHTDSKPYNTARRDIQAKVANNWELSSLRAIQAYSELITHNPQLNELRNLDNEYLFGVSGYADNRRLVQNEEKDEDFQKNRRIEVNFLFHTLTLDQFKSLLDDIKLEGKLQEITNQN